MRSIADHIEAILAEMPHDMPESEVASRLAMVIQAFHNRMGADRARVCWVLDRAWQGFMDLAEE